jgi:hypothetical protein
MSNEKMTISGMGKASVISTVRGHRDMAGARPPAPEVIKLEIDENDDFGSDPYNRTGTHCVLKIRDDA